jgi:hypothetical protein
MARRKDKAGDWMEAEKAAVKPFAVMQHAPKQESAEDYYGQFKGGKNKLQEAYAQIAEGKAVVDEAWLFTGRFGEDGKLLRECDKGDKPYRMRRVVGHEGYRAAVLESQRHFAALPAKIEEARKKAAAESAVREAVKGVSEASPNFQSSSDAGSLMQYDPNQYTEFTPFFGGPQQRQQYWDQFTALARAFEQWNHNPVAHRVVTILCQYALGRGFKIQCHNDKLADKWEQHARDTKLYIKLRRYWPVQVIVDGELFIDKQRWQSIDASSIWDIICENEGGDDLDHPLYYQQMFQTITQTYAGIPVPGVSGSGQTNIGHYIIRQLPYDRVLHYKFNCYEMEKRGRSALYPIMGFLKKLMDTIDAKVIAEQLGAAFVWDDLVKGDAGQVTAHAQAYAYMPPPGSTFAHNEAIDRQPMSAKNHAAGSKTDIVQEIIAICAACLGIPKEHLNVIITGGGSRANALVASEPFTKVIEELQEAFEDIIYDLIAAWCEQVGAEFKINDWEAIFPSVSKDSTGDTINNLTMAESTGAISHEQMSTMIAAELEITNYDYDDVQAARKKDAKNNLAQAVGAQPTLPPASRFGKAKAAGKAGSDPEAPENNPIHQGKAGVKDEMATL